MPTNKTAKPAYSTVPQKFVTVFNAIRKKGIPPVADAEWLARLGLNDNNDKSLLGVLNALAITDADGKPTKRWSDLRGSKHEEEMTAAIKHAYADLFAFDSNAHEMGDNELADYFSGATSYGNRTVTQVIRTFRATCALSTMKSGAQAPPPVARKPKPKERAKSKKPTKPALTVPEGQQDAQPITVNVNIQLSLPPGATSEDYDNLLASLNRHVIRKGRDVER